MRLIKYSSWLYHMHPKDLSISDFTYTLPEERIASYPLPGRDESKLLVYKEGAITEDRYRFIASHIPEGALLVFNNTKVVEARLLFQKPTGGMIEIFCLEPHEQYPDITSAMLQKEKVFWKCLVGGASKWKPGQVLVKEIRQTDENIILHAVFREKRTDHFLIELSWTPPSLSFAEILHRAGAVPLPPYIKRAPGTVDTERYQTIYAHYEGSVAAPTAGLHFTEQVFRDLEKKNIQKEFVTLHVGAGTFKPVKAERMQEHEMHAEFMEVSRATIENIRRHLNGTVIAVGTTSLRTIESLYWLGVKLSMDHGPRSTAGYQNLLTLSQWEAYDLKQDTPPSLAFDLLLHWMEKNGLDSLLARTQIIIAPGYRFRVAKALVTNFHQPQSTLLLLVAAAAGNDWKQIYAYALEHGFRFLSYGDGSLLWIRNTL